MLVKETKNMKTHITLRLFESQRTDTKAFIELKLDDVLIVKGLSLVKGRNGLFLSFPAAKGKDGKYYNSVYSLDKDWREKLEDECIRKYKKAKEADNHVTEREDFS